MPGAHAAEAIVEAVVDDPHDHHGLREASAAQKARLVELVLQDSFGEKLCAQVEAVPRRQRLLGWLLAILQEWTSTLLGHRGEDSVSEYVLYCAVK